MSRALKKKLHKNGSYPIPVAWVYTRRRLGDYPGMYGKMEQFIKPAQLEPYRPRFGGEK